MKRIIASVLCIAILLSSRTTFWAMDNDIVDYNEFDTSTYEYYQKVSEIAEARGITLMPYDKIIASNVSSIDESGVETISYDYVGKNEISVNKKIELEKITTVETKGGTSQSDAQTISVSTATFDSIDTAGEADWFKFQVNGNGAHNLYTTGDTDTKVEFYTRTWYGTYTLIDSNDDGGDGLNCRLELGLTMNVDYYVKVTAYSGNTGYYMLRIDENKDSTQAPNGGSWTWDIADPDPDGVYFNIDKITYLTADEAQGYYIMVSTDSFKEVRDKILSLSFDAAVAYLMGLYKIESAVASFIVAEAASCTLPSLTDLECESIAEAGGMNSNGTFSNGIKIISVTTYSSVSVPVLLNTYESWSGSFIYGEPRYRGTFDLTDKTPMWR